jgi:hypothetical protein
MPFGGEIQLGITLIESSPFNPFDNRLTPVTLCIHPLADAPWRIRGYAVCALACQTRPPKRSAWD